MKLSVLIPSNRPEGLARFFESARKHSADFNSIEFIVLTDAPVESVTREDNIVYISYPPTNPLSIGKLLERCYKESTGDWILFCNDDIVINTTWWNVILKDKIKQYAPDGIGLFWPDDGMFGNQLACFPVVSRKVLDLIKFFPTPYRRYKIDDTLFQVMPPEKRIYIPDISFTHSNDNGTDGYKLPDGRIYPIDREAADYDNQMWNWERHNRERMRSILNPVVATKVLIAVPTAEFARRADFYDYYNQLEKPAGTICTFAHGQSPAKNRNLMIEQALEHKCTHILFLDDDTAFNSDLLTRLLAHNKDVVTGLYLMRNFPHKPIIFDKIDGAKAGYYNLNGDRGLIPITNCGLGCVLIKIEVFKKLENPWITLGEIEKDQWCDDISFFNRVRNAGFSLFCDLNCVVGHFASITIWPTRVNDKWHIAYDSKGTSQVSFPIPE